MDLSAEVVIENADSNALASREFVCCGDCVNGEVGGAGVGAVKNKYERDLATRACDRRDHRQDNTAAIAA